jgi:hypothetical protein
MIGRWRHSAYPRRMKHNKRPYRLRKVDNVEFFVLVVALFVLLFVIAK